MPHTEQSTEQPVVNIVGERVALGPLRDSHWPVIARWENDFEVDRFFQIPGPRRPEDVAGQFGPNGFLGGSSNVAFAVYRTSDWTFIGIAGLVGIDHAHRTAEFFIMLGDVQTRGHGLGTETTRLVLDYAFYAQGLHSVRLGVFSYNRAGIRAYERAGFRRVGVQRQNRMMGGRLWDTILMDILATEFESPVLQRVMLGGIDMDTDADSAPAPVLGNGPR